MDDNRKTVKISSSRTTRPASAGRSSASGAPQRRSSARPAPAKSAPPRKPSGSAPKQKSKGLSIPTALIIAVAAVIVICVPLILITTSAANPDPSVTQENEPILIAPVTAVPGENSTTEEDLPVEQDPETQAPETTVKSYQRDDEDPEIARIQQRLMELGYMAKSEPTELFGPATEESVKLFQIMNDITSTGICDAETQEALYSEQTENFVLAEGAENIAVSQLQSRLRELGYLNASSTAYFGSATTSAIKNFQRQNGLDADGMVGISTWNKLFSSSAAKAPVPSASPSTNASSNTET